MRKTSKIVALLGTFVGLTLSACDLGLGNNQKQTDDNSDGGNGGHTHAHVHKFSGEYSSDAQYHWFECEECHEKQNKAEHDFIQNWVPATYESAGYYHYECWVCGYEYDGEPEGDPLTHNYSQTYYYDDETGHYHYCIDQGYTDLKSPTEPHVFNEWQIVDEATEEHPGLKRRACQYCGYHEEQEIPQLVHEHTYSNEWSSDDYYHWHAATCGHDVKDGYAEHDFEITVHEPTFEDGGYTHYRCKVCGYEYNDEYTSPKQHTYSDQWSVDEDYHWHACTDTGYEDLYIDRGYHLFSDWVISTQPSQTERGLEYRTCSTCGYREEREIESFDEKTIRCLSFTLNDDGESYSISGAQKNSLPDRVFLPDEYNGKPVTKVNGYVFHQATKITELVMGSNIKEIGDYAFANLYNMTHLQLNEGLETIRSDAFINHKLESITLPSTVKTVGSYAFREYYGEDCFTTIFNLNEGLKSIGEQAFYTNNPINLLTIPSSVETIGSKIANVKEVHYDAISATKSSSEAAFYNIKTLVIGDNVTSVPNYICSSQKLRTIVVGASVETFASYSFYSTNVVEVINLSSLEIVKGSSDHGYVAKYASFVTTQRGEFIEENNFEIYRNSGESLLVSYSGNARIVTIPDGITQIKKEAFSSNQFICQIIIPSSVTAIDQYAFSSLNRLLSVVNLSSVELTADKFNSCVNIIEKVSSLEASEFELLEDYAAVGDILGRYLGTDTNITLPSGYKSVHQNFAANIKTLVSVTIPEGYTQIGNYAFSQCTNLETISLPETLTKIWAYGFYGCGLVSITFPDSLSELGRYAFSYCNRLREVNFGSSLSVLEEQTFSYTSSLESIVIPDNITVFNERVFYYSGLKNVTLPNRIDKIAHDIFEDCDYLITNDYENCKYLGNSSNEHYMFVGFINTKVSSVSIANECEVYCDPVDNYSRSQFEIEEITYGENLKLVPYTSDSLFDHQYTSQTIKTINYNCIDFNYKSIYGYNCLFNDGNYSCSNIVETLNIGPKVKSIPSRAFKFLSNITELSIPDSVERVGSEAFDQLTNVTPNTEAEGTYEYFGNSGNPHLYLKKATGSAIDVHSDCKIIGSSAIASYQIITSISLPDGITQIGYNAFKEKSFNGGNLILPDSVKYIEEGAFQQFYLTHSTDKKIGIGKNVEEIHPTAFKKAYFAKIKVDSSNEYFNSEFNDASLLDINNKKLIVVGEDFGASASEITLGSNYETICTYSLYRSTAKTLHMPYVKFVESSAFGAGEGNTSLEYITFGEPLQTIGSSAFIDCSNLKGAVLAGSVSLLDSSTFERCRNLKYVVIPASLKSISNRTFEDTSNVKILTPLKESEYHYEEINGVSQIIYGFVALTKKDGITYALADNDEGKFAYPVDISGATDYLYDESNMIEDVYHELPVTFREIVANKNLEHIVIPEGVTEIPDFTFNVNHTIKSVSIPSTCKTIGTRAFRDCTSLTQVTLHEGVETIAEEAFTMCSNLKTINIPSSVKTIGDFAFDYCALETVTFHEGLEEIGSHAFTSNKLEEVVIPSSVSIMRSFVFSSNKDGLLIHCAAESKPSGWSENWCSYYLPPSYTVVNYDVDWGYTA